MFDNDTPRKLVTIPEVEDNRSLEERMGFHPTSVRAAPAIDTQRPNMKLTQHEKALRLQARRMALDFSAEMITTLYTEAKTAPASKDRIDAANKLLLFALGKPPQVVTNEDGTAIVPNFNITFSNQVTGDVKPVVEATVDADAD